MKNSGYYFELKYLLQQFCSAFDDVVISRYNKDKAEQEKIEVRYVFGPKERVMYDTVNKAQNLTLPVIAVNLTAVARDPSRVFNKIEPTYLPAVDRVYGSKVAKVLSPIPVNLEVSVSILTKFMGDMDQIISNFVPYSNPYIIISWLMPEEFGLGHDTEIRSEVLWGGSISYSMPTDIAYSDKFRVVADTSFTIKGWLFKEMKDPQGIIYKIDNRFHSVKASDPMMYLDDFNSLSSYATTDVVTVSGCPSITNLFYTLSGTTFTVHDPITIDMGKDNNFIVYGKGFDWNNSFYLSSNKVGFYSNYSQISVAKSPVIYAYDFTDRVSVLNQNIFTMHLPANTLTSTGIFTIVTANSAGWASTNDGYGITVA